MDNIISYFSFCILSLFNFQTFYNEKYAVPIYLLLSHSNKIISGHQEYIYILLIQWINGYLQYHDRLQCKLGRFAGL